MSEESKKVRTLEQVQQDYQSGAMRAGHLQYQIYALKRDLELVNESLKDLNFEAASIQAAASKPTESKETANA